MKMLILTVLLLKVMYQRNVCHHSLIYFAFPAQDYSSLNYLDIVVDATLSLTNSPENIGLKQEKLDTKVETKANYFGPNKTFSALHLILH